MSKTYKLYIFYTHFRKSYSAACFRDLLAPNIVSFLTLIFSFLFHVILCVGVTDERKLLLKKRQGSWPINLLNR